ncbi:MAG TPA: Zn-dependent protease [candidate division WOR-3 bacterium]|uniref:Zn-dependent protease n=1 Tax=candidate division WOR-3 bacterium TaxID=2052148 RepID=A0A9C9JZ86_UNCW3|nr:Zn-dependent protease [candidate division WOR-3 bacterium]
MIDVYQQKSLNYFEVVKDVIRKYLDLNVFDAGSFEIPANAYNPLRQQYNAMHIINYLITLSEKKKAMKLGIVDVDIYSQGMNFIFGLAAPLQKTALVSTHRLFGERLLERISKEVIHELGHLLGLRHCSNEKCVMRFSMTIQDTDDKDLGFCKECRSKIE